MTRVLFFGRLRDIAGRREWEIELPPHVATIADLRTWLADRDGALAKALGAPGIHVAVNQVICQGDSAPVSGASEIAFMPPLSGG